MFDRGISKNIKIGVLLGGVSAEREISLLSGRQAAEALIRRGFMIKELDLNSSSEDTVKNMIRIADIDAAFIALHGRFGEDGWIQKILDDMDIPYTGSRPYASFLCMDKAASKEIFRKNAVPTPDFSILQKGEKVKDDILLPKVVKPSANGSSIGVSIVKTTSDFKKALAKGFSAGDTLIIEDYIGGREFTVGILDETPLGVVEIIPKGEYFDFTTKYSDGLCDFRAPADIDNDLYDEIQRIALLAHKGLGCSHFSRVDLKVNENNEPLVLEVNSIPGLTSHSLLPLSAKVSGINFDELCGIIMEMTVKNVQKESEKV